MDGAGRTILRDARRGTEQQPIVANLLKAIVDDWVALTSQIPDTKVPKRGTTWSAETGTLEALGPDDQAFADMLEKFHYGVWWASRMRLHCKAKAWFNSVMGSCAGLVWPDFSRRHMKMRIIGPDKVFGVPDLLDEYAFSSAVIIESFSAKTIQDYFPNKRFRTFVEEQTARRATWWGESGRIEVIRWFDKGETVTILGREVTNVHAHSGRSSDGPAKIEGLVEMGRAQHYTGQCMVVPFQNFLIPGELRSISDIEEAVGLNQWINFLMNAHEEGIRQELFSPLVLIDPDKAPEDIDLSDPMTIIPINKGGDAKRLPGPTGIQQVMSGEMARGQQLIEYVTGSSAIRTQGRQPSSSIATGRSLEKGQAPQMSRVDMRNDLDGMSFEKMNELSVLGTYTMFENDKIDLFGTQSRSGSSMYKMSITGKDLSGYVYNIVSYPPSMYMGMEQRIVAMEQLLGGKHPMVSVRTAMEFIGLVDHPDEELVAIEEDQMRLVEAEKRLAAAGTAGAPASGAAPQGALRRAVSLGAGSTKPLAPGGAAPAQSTAMGGGAALGAASATGQAPLAAGGPPPLPQGTVDSGLGGSLAEQVERAVQGARPKGRTYLVDQGEKVEVLVSSQADLLKLRRKLMPFFGGKVRVRETKNIPPEAKEVGRGAPPTQGQAVAQDQQARP